MKTRKRIEREAGRPIRFSPRARVSLALGLVLATALAAAQEAGFRETTRMPARRQMHGAAVLGDFLYVVGGVIGNEQYTDSVHKAPIQPDGTLGAWSETTHLPGRRSYIANSTIALNDMIYVIGGADDAAGTKFNTAVWAKPQPDGSLSAWSESPPFGPEGLSCLTTVSTPGFIHILGGSNQSGEPTDTVISGILDAEGRLVSWEKGPPLPSPLWFHHAVATAGRVWVWGGMVTSNMRAAEKPVSSSVYSAPILSTGRLGPWRTEPTGLPLPFYSAATASVGPFLMSFCPRDAQRKATTDVWFAAATRDGVANWQKVGTSLPVKLYIAAAPDYRRGTIYIPGGRIDPQERDESVEDRVFYFALSPQVRKAAEEQLAYTQSAATSPTEYAAGADQGRPASAQYTYVNQGRLAEGAAQGFMPYTQARLASLQTRDRPLILYFNLKGAKPCETQTQKLADPQVAALTQQAYFAWIENREWPQLVQQIGIYRCPAWVIYNPRGEECGRFFGVLEPSQLAAGIQTCR